MHDSDWFFRRVTVRGGRFMLSALRQPLVTVNQWEPGDPGHNGKRIGP
jgi:hypothetical protein